MMDTVLQMTENIIQAPDDEKYRQLKMTNKALQSKVLCHNGGLDLLRIAGFRKETTDRQAVLHMDNANTAHLQELQGWIREQVAAALNMEGAQMIGAKVCAECTIQFRLPAGLRGNQPVFAAFFRHERLGAALDFAKKLLPPSRRAVAEVRLPFASMDLGSPDHLGQTIEAAGLVPRATLMVVAEASPEGAEARAPKKAPSEAAALAAARAERERCHRLLQEQRKADRERVLLQFQEDRKEFQDKNSHPSSQNQPDKEDVEMENT